MDFFDAQDQAKRATRWLVIVYVVSTALIVAGVTAVVAVLLAQMGVALNEAVLGITALATALFIMGASLFKTAVLSGGGSKVAEQMGGTRVAADTRDALQLRLRNVVEEMSIASGVPVPDIYVLEKEQGINAFAAGFTPGDAAVAVTRGTLELLDRDELQGVIAHEFSHILNGDMRLNIRMMGVLFGIMIVGLIGRMILRGGRYSGFASSRRSKNAGGIMLVGLGLTLLGWIGVFFSRLIKAAVSRQREYLADASAVQFTRQTDGIANALKKIGGFNEHSYLRAADPEEVSHMLFGQGQRSLSSMFATHPPLTERIRAIDPSFRESDYPEVRPLGAGSAEQSEQAAAFAGEAVATPAAALVDNRVTESIGRPTPEHLGLARQLRQTIPETLEKGAHSPSGAWLLTVALMIDPNFADRQFSIIESKLGEVRAMQVREYYNELQSLGARYWLPVLEIAFPALKQRPAKELEFLLDLLRELAEVDGNIDLREFCFYRIVARHLQQAAAPSKAAGGNRVSKSAARQAAVELLRIVADQGNTDDEKSDRAFRSGLRVFGDWAGNLNVPANAQGTVQRLDRALETLSRLNSAGRRSLVDAVARTIAHDDRMTMREAELLRAICATLECPLPPMISAA